MNIEQLKSSWQRLPETTAPFGYDEFVARVQARDARRRLQRRAGAGAGGALALLLVVAVGWRALQPPAALDLSAPGEPAAAVSAATVRVNDAPALVNADTYVAVVALEDRLAWFDDALSEARVGVQHSAADPVRVRELEFERDRLAQSLRQVKYAAELSAAM